MVPDPGGTDYYPDLIGDPKLLICPSDPSNGEDGSKPDSDQYETMTGDDNQYTETDDLDNNTRVDACSYMYEFSEAPCSWWNADWDTDDEWYVIGSSSGSPATDEQADINNDTIVSWAEAKLMQLEHGDSFSQDAYDRSRFPLVRCFHHYQDKPVLIRSLNPDESGKIRSSVRVLNLAMDGKVFLSGSEWEHPLAN